MCKFNITELISCQKGAQNVPGREAVPAWSLHSATELLSLPRTVLWSHLLREPPFTVRIISDFMAPNLRPFRPPLWRLWVSDLKALLYPVGMRAREFL